MAITPAYASKQFPGILTHDVDPHNILRTRTSTITAQDWHVVQETVDRLLYIRSEVLKGGAGLAASQVGISQPIFIYSPDRSDRIVVVVNPSYTPVGEDKIEEHEACFSVPLHCTAVPRWKTIQVKYQMIDGTFVEEVLNGFSAKVFQHEMDHLEGQLTIDHPEGSPHSFETPQSFKDHMHQIHTEDSKSYQRKNS
jgi:peptide deformylase